jgi:hypothetical protein
MIILLQLVLPPQHQAYEVRDRGHPQDDGCQDGHREVHDVDGVRRREATQFQGAARR